MEINEFDPGSKVNRYQGEAKAVADEIKEKKQPDQPSPVKEPSADKVQLSQQSREIARAKELAETAPAVRQEKVEAIKAKLAAGTYDVEAEDVADRMLKEALQELI
ncbi:MAG: flagellar biosynthesis anti-sigma factor FlgM [Deltaproteobacteria bacterium]|nr:flagellar biosynthesis anti-sigma factor FlgM [Deltaproteobacteria bacterium]